MEINGYTGKPGLKRKFLNTFDFTQAPAYFHCLFA